MLKFTFTAFLVLLCSIFVQANTPACVLACVNKHEKLGDFKAICETKVQQSLECLNSACSDKKVGLEGFAERCKANGNFIVDIAPKTTTTGSTTLQTSTTQSGNQPTGSSNPTGGSSTTPRPSGSAVPQDSGAERVLAIGSVAIAALVAGVLAL